MSFGGELVVPFSNMGLVCFVLGNVLAVHDGNSSDKFLFAILTQGSSKVRETLFAATPGYGVIPLWGRDCLSLRRIG
ncbi:hypothetical protein Pla144_38670 [Bythopirellula polymerisocia]|uniref:Uncharacterized protein n=1 Tax=Bythopirellula polymerisocia TaxID=2528003 RepID=A0A5C6CHL5_9BACT|nr:hypothetical protein Pla144_38670 [Bythopirellula polymerisocia]